MVLKVGSKVASKKSYLITALAVLTIGVAIVAFINHENKPKDIPQNKGYTLPNYVYTFLSSNINCKVIPSYPGSATTTNYCTGNLTVVNKDKKTQITEVTFTSAFYKNGTITALDQLNNLQPNKSKLALTYFDKEQKRVKSITYVE